jgi:hypothetical protein
MAITHAKTWAYGELFTSTQANDIHTSLNKALDKTGTDNVDGYHTYRTGAQIALANGATLSTGNGSLVDIDGDLVVAGQAELFNAELVSVQGELNLESGAEMAIKNSAAVFVQSGGEITGQSGCLISLESGGSILCLSGSTLGVFGTLSGTPTVSAKLTLSGTQAGIAYRVTTGTDAAITLATTYDYYYVPTITANRNWTLPSTNVVQGQTLTIMRYNPDATFNLFIKNIATTTIGTLPNSQASCATFIYRGSDWVPGPIGGGATVAAYP